MKVPKLRFRGFSDEWVQHDLGKLVSQMQSGLSRKLSSNDIGLPVIRSNNIKNQSVDTSDISYWYADDPQGAKTNNYCLEDGDLLINFINSLAQIGKFAVYENTLNRPVIFTTNIMRLKFNNKTSSKFIAYEFSRKRYIDFIQSITKPAVNQASFTTVDLKKYKLVLPEKSEQQKIAGFLGVVDDKISGLQNKNELLKKYKKGAMQAIFSQKIRFKDENGKNYPDWQKKKLNEIAKVYDGTHQTPSYKASGIPFYSVEHITNDDFRNTKFVSEEVYAGEVKRVIIEKGDILMTRIGDIGTSKLISWNVKASFYVSLALIKQSRVNNSAFLNQYIKTDFFQRELWRKTIHVAFPKKINLGEIGNCALMLPTLKEQEKIADFLTSIDDKINLTKKELEQAKTFKKALLQQMFV